MSSGERSAQGHECSGDAAAYVLGALSPEEAEVFRAHLAGCAICRDEVATLQRVADALPMAAEQYEVPRGLRRRTLRAVRTQPRGASAAPGRDWRRILPGISLPRPALAGGLAAVIALAVLAGVELGSSGGGSTRVIAATTSVGTAEVRLSGGHAELIVRGMPAPPPGHIYEVWLKRAGQPPTPTRTLFSVTSRGAGDVGLPGNLRGVSQVLVTPEPAGGSLAPTHPPVIDAQLD